jgi:hypothetical protein
MTTKLIRYVYSFTCTSVESALNAAFAPFGSLPFCVAGEQNTLAKNAKKWVDSHSVSVAMEILCELRSADVDQTTSVEFGDCSIYFRTPTSGTIIQLHRFAGGYEIVVNFGGPSTERKSIICSAAQEAGFEFDSLPA